ncbi:MAG TPA: hypothetical protein VLZ89_13460 [Anaerolineales bacterium]|nr:hypothetical protein [Anaerolineales bacterium]
MKTVWKWILGIVIVLVVAGLVVGAVFAWQHGFTFSMRRAPFAYRQYQQTAPNAPAQPNTQNNNQTKPAAPNGTMPNRRMMGRGFGYPGGGFGYGPMMAGRGLSPFGMFMPFGPFGMMGFMFFGFFRLLIPLAVLAVVAYIFYQLGKHAGMAAVVPPPANPAPLAATPSRTKK